jgi:hypothetical protein
MQAEQPGTVPGIQNPGTSLPLLGSLSEDVPVRHVVAVLGVVVFVVLACVWSIF